METHKMVVLSTAHMPRHQVEEMEKCTAQLHNSNAPQYGFTMAVYPEGFVVSCTSVDPEPQGPSPLRLPEPTALHALRKWTAEQGFTYLMLDADGDLRDDLPDFSNTWE